jgi:hypothetical protein
MISTMKKSGLFGAGLLLAVAAGAPAVADDTELLLVNRWRSGHPVEQR